MAHRVTLEKLMTQTEVDPVTESIMKLDTEYM